jgi:hypothetical protein
VIVKIKKVTLRVNGNEKETIEEEFDVSEFVHNYVGF